MNIASNTRKARLLGLALGTAIASGALSGCASGQAPHADLSASKANSALQRGNSTKAVRHAEAAALGEPRNAAHRVTLGMAYLQEGRFRSAATSFEEAMELGDSDPHTIVSRSLALTASGQPAQAYRLLDAHRETLQPADLGLALALAGDPGQGAMILGDALRSGSNDAKTRQNFAYALALSGDWRSARIMVAEDVPADKVADRINEWAQTASPNLYGERIAGLLGTAVDPADAGRPERLALANHADVEMMAAEAVADRELPSLAQAVPQDLSHKAADVHAGEPAAVEGPVRVALAPSQASQFAPRRPAEVNRPATQAAVAQQSKPAAPPVAKAAVTNVGSAKPAAAKPASLTLVPGDHLVQLGSYLTEADAKRAWGVFQSRYPVLSKAQLVVTRAEVKGKTYYRVAAGNLNQGSAQGLCGLVKRSGNGCIAYAKSKPLPGAVAVRPVRVASR